MITFTANIRSASARSDDAITTSSVGIPVQLVLADEFMGLAKTLVFKAGSTAVDVVLVGDATEAVVPPDVLTTVGLWLGIGIYAADSEGNVVIPTVWASAGLIQQGTVPSGVDPSEPTPSWVAQVQSIASEASENAESALNKATAVEEAAARGGFDGRDGTDGFSPIVTVTEISGGHEVAITDANGTQTFTVLNGTNGTDGTDGVDGFSPTVSVEEIPRGHRVTITDIDGEHAFDVMDGQGGGGGGAVDSVNGYTGDVWLTASDVGALPDTTTIPTKTSQLQNDSGFITSAPVQSVNGKTGAVVLDADDVGALPDDTTAADLGAYVKPSGGIPKTDLASAVQTSLGKADTAYQKPSGGIPATDIASGVIPSVPSAYTSNPAALGTASPGSSTSWARGDHVHAKPTYSKSDVGLGNVDNVQQYSATNPPPYPVTSVNGSTGAVSLSIPSSASDVGAIAAPSSPATGAFLVWNGSAWVAQTLATWQASSY